MIWYQPLIGPLPHDLLEVKRKEKVSAEETLRRGREYRLAKIKRTALSAFSRDEWLGATAAAKRIGRTPHALRKQAALLVKAGCLETRGKMQGASQLQWRITASCPQDPQCSVRNTQSSTGGCRDAH